MASYIAVFLLYFQPTPRNKLGAKAVKCLKKGQAVDDQVLVDVLVETIR